jgi:hypothetical protein
MVNQNTCLPMRIGVETRIDASELLSNIFPGSTLIMDILFAMQGEAQAVSGGYNLNFFGGFENRAAPAACVSGITLANPPTRPTDIPLAASLQNSEEAHVVVGVAERMMDWAGYQLWEGGTLCIEAGTRLDQLLSTGLFSVLIGSLNDLAFPSSGAPSASRSARSSRPTITLGAGTEEDPFLTVALPELALDFYVWSTERYVRFMTFTSDVVAQVNLPLSNGAITPADRARVARQLVGEQQRAHS